jgi:hypothetical protein
MVVRYQTAVNLCLTHIQTDPWRFYGTAVGMPLGAGLLIRDCVLAHPDPQVVEYRTIQGPALVLTHECDVDPANERYFNDMFLVCPIMPLDEFCEGIESQDGVGAWGGILREVAADKVYRAMYLPPVPAMFHCPEMEGGGVIYLNHISASRVEWVRDLAGQAMCSLSAPALRFLDIKMHNHLIREKATALWFSR